jgi:ATP-dependent RNA helicase DeaD
VQNSEEIDSLKGDRALEIAPVYGGASMELQLRRLRRGVHVVVGTPGRVLDHLRRGSLVLDNLKFMVLDEADEMLDMGFIEDIEEVLKQTPQQKRMLCFSATMPLPIQTLAQNYMVEPTVVKIEEETMTSVLTDQGYVELKEGDKLEALTRIIDMEETFYGIVFCRTRVQCDEVGHKLSSRGYNAEALHGDLSQKQRESILNRMRERRLSIIVATDVAARGLDISDLTHVINYSLPEDPEAYIHRIGRTGRAGKRGVAITFVTPREFKRFSFIKRVAKSDIQKINIPEAGQIIKAKRERITAELIALIETASVDGQFPKMADKLLHDKDAKEVVSALLGHFYGDELDFGKYEPITPAKERDERSGFTRLFIARGRRDGLDKRLLVDYLIERVGASDRDIQGVSVQEDFSFVTAPNDVAEQIMSVFNSYAPHGKPLITRAKPDNPNNKNLSTRRRGKRGRYDDRQRGGQDRRDRPRSRRPRY